MPRSPSPERWSLDHSHLLELGLLCVVVLVWPATSLRAQTVNHADANPEYRPGLLAEYSGKDFRTFVRVDEDIAFEGAAARDRRILGETYQVRWSGFLDCKENGAFKFHCFAAGQVVMRIDGITRLESRHSQPAWMDSQAIELTFGRHAIEIVFEAQAGRDQFGLYWSGPQFALEPISHRFFSHVATSEAPADFDRGAELVRALRCGACHASETSAELPAPALTHLRGNIDRQWAIRHLTQREEQPDAGRRMPLFGLDRSEASTIIDTLLQASMVSADPPPYVKPKPAKSSKKDDKPARVDPSVADGQTTFRSVGCLACHQAEEVGKASLFDGGSLADVARKRPAEFFARWLHDPASVNAQHRMPVFDLTALQRADLALYLSSLVGDSDEASSPPNNRQTGPQSESGLRQAGKDLLARYQCGACHLLPGNLAGPPPKRLALNESSRWFDACTSASDATKARPGYALTEADRKAIKDYWLAQKAVATKPLGQALLKEHNCTGCHARDAQPGLASLAVTLLEVDADLASRLAALLPPSLTGVGDKLRDEALVAVLSGKDVPRRPWLDVRMPKFRLLDPELESLAHHLISHDRIPELQSIEPEMPTGKAVELAAARLVTPEGFGCQSCHQIGTAEPPKVAINAHGTNLTMLGERIRSSWFHRWVRNPARIVPRMEMPAIQVAAKGVLNDNLDLQLAALWKTLNTAGFEPPKPNPVRVVRNYNQPDLKEPANVLTDVLETPGKKYLRPLIVGLPNRHTVLFDLESGRLAQWWLGDTARQYTRGKSWYWDAGSSSLALPAEYLQAIALVDGEGNRWRPATNDQFVIQFDGLQHVDQGVRWYGRMELQHAERSRWLRIDQTVQAVDAAKTKIHFNIEGLTAEELLVLNVPEEADLREVAFGREANFGAHATVRWHSVHSFRALGDRQFALAAAKPNSPPLSWSIELTTDLPADRFQRLELAPPELQPVSLDCVPGFEAIQLPLLRNEMPTALAWSPTGQMYMASLKGRVFRLSDTNGDGLHDRFDPVSDDLPAPYGLMVHEKGIDVLCKTSLIRLQPPESPTESTLYSQQVVADGWGYTADYHDWAVGLVRDRQDNYLIALPCQQDDRSEAAARWRGHALRLVPTQETGSARAYRLESLSAGLRFPMGMALNSAGDLFATDNQGNYNPFNELNHLRPGKRYGFINKLENKPGFSPPFESPAVNLPHPWTRSVNGLCFLESPANAPNAFGPFEGDLIGCEYNGLSLIRMSLQQVGDQYQGAAYAFSRPVQTGEATFEGPVSCAVAPSGELYVGSIHDSGWGGGANTGSIVRLRFRDTLPLGIDEVRATPRGLEIRFTQPVDPQRATQATAFSIRSYRRVSTPAYGGEDQDERAEVAQNLRLSEDRRSVQLELAALREGCVYEVNVAAIGADDQPLFPSQAHYHMRRIPLSSDQE